MTESEVWTDSNTRLPTASGPIRYLYLAIVVLVVACGGDAMPEDEYRLAVTAATTELMSAWGDLMMLFDDVALPPEQLDAEAWVESAVAYLDTTHEIHTEVVQLDPPQELEQVHQMLLAATECYRDAARVLRPEINQRGPALVGASVIAASCESLLREASVELEQAGIE